MDTITINKGETPRTGAVTTTFIGFWQHAVGNETIEVHVPNAIFGDEWLKAADPLTFKNAAIIPDNVWRRIEDMLATRLATGQRPNNGVFELPRN